MHLFSCGALRTILACAGIAVLVAIAPAQAVREESWSGSQLRSSNRAAKEAGLGWWPDLAPGTTNGTQVTVSFGFYDADITIYTTQQYPKERLLATARAIASQLGMPRSDYILTRARRLQSADIEMNKYVSIKGNVSTLSYSIESLASALKYSDLPKPIGIRINQGEKHSMLLDSKDPGENVFFNPENGAPGGLLSLRSERSWVGLAAAIFLGLAGLAALTLPLVVLLRLSQKGMPQPAVPGTPPKSLEEAQRIYDSGTKRGSARLIPFIGPLVVVFLTVVLPPVLREADPWIPGNVESSLSRWFMFVPLAYIPVIFFILRKAKKQRDALGVPQPETSPEEQASLKVMRFVPFAIVPIFLLFIVMRAAPQLTYGIPVTVLRTLIRVVAFAPVAAMIVFMVIAFRRSGGRLKPGDRDYDAVMELAKSCGIKVRRVVERKTKIVNASASAFGTVTLTSGARERLTAEERRAVLAHEVGHLRSKHPQKFFVLSLALIATWIAVDTLCDSWFKLHLPEGLYILWHGPLIVIFVLPVVVAWVMAPARKKAEIEADRFALRSTGDYSTVAVALAKIHLFNGAPHTFRPMHEMIASHPSLVKRLDALRAAAKSLGWPIDESGVEALFTGAKVTEAATSDA